MLRRSARKLEHALDRPYEAQRELLATLLRQSAKTEYGRVLGLKGDESYTEFSRKVPIVKYEQLEPWIERQKSTGYKVLSSGKVALYEKTSGSSGGKKYIPYTRELLGSFHTLVFVWLHDLLANGPELTTGKVFFSISQPFQDPEIAKNGTPVGMGNDTDYLSPLTRFFLGSCFIAPPGISQIKDPLAYKRVLAGALLAEEKLEIISIWNPTYLTTLLDYIVQNRETLVRDLRSGSVTVEGRRFEFAPLSAARARQLESGEPSWPAIWPELKLLSCWTDGSAEFFARRLYREFPGVTIQGKGLLATEAPMTVPLFGAPGPVPLTNEIFFEFEGEDGIVRRIHELRAGKTYELIFSQKGGFLRYRIGDRVTVVGQYRQTPCFRFCGRANDVSDLVGEKLNAQFVHAALDKVIGARAEDSFSFLVPMQREGEPSFYYCITSEHRAGDWAAELERELGEAHQYSQARKLGQLGPLRMQVAKDARDAYYGHFMSRGMKWGDIKFSPLMKSADDDFLHRLGVA
ncbi:GH3 auxin-responsive promoter family protein [Pendulispora rubella]|uniref:GH3 auxin-responsive promoter family protein n=1 Tax=Pendulispora rubella TaxID=2741070 RepID=A0ABZ2KVY9_9BACT